MKYLSMLLIMVAMSVCMVGCGDDDDEPISKYNDFYIEADVQGGGLSASELNEAKADMNVILAKITSSLKGIDSDTAIYAFDSFMKDLKNELKGGIVGIEGSLQYTFTLKTTEGATIKKATLRVTKDSCTLG